MDKKPLVAYTEEMMKWLIKAKSVQLRKIKKINNKAQELLEKAKGFEENKKLLDDLS